MEEKDNKIDFVKIMFRVVYLFLMILFSLSKIAAIIFCSVCVSALLVYYVFQWIPPSVEILERRICKCLDRQGYQHMKKEGDLYITNNNCHYRIQLSEGYNRRIKHLYVLYKFGDDNFNKVTMEGWSRASNVINVRNTEIIFVTLEDHFCCCYQSAIGNSKDFMREFGRANDSIGKVVEDYCELYPYLERDYPNHTGTATSIGFRQNEP